MRKMWLSAALALVVYGPAFGQPAARFQWRAGDILSYRVTETIAKKEVVDGKLSEATTKLQHLKQWKVLDVDNAGSATLEQSLRSFRLEQPTPAGEVLVFDSEHLDQSDPQLREQLAKYVGTPLATLRLDNRGRLLEVRESRNGPANRFESQLPFVLTLPEQGPIAAQTWERRYQVTLEPPAGLGEKYDAAQKYECKSTGDGVAAIIFATTIKAPPQNPAEQVPLLLLQSGGEIQFDLQAGRLKLAHLHLDREVKNHAGPGSSFRLSRTYREEYAGGN